jgi:murein DD-endopeptidase MepM/ murein hydrolase activator NlpD
MILFPSFRAVSLTAIVISFLFSACGPSQKGLFGKRSAHEKYADGITDAGLQQTRLGRLWFAAAEKSLAQPVSITLPYKEAGYYPAENPGASGYIFSARRGELLQVNVTTVPSGGFLYFIELWEPGTDGKSPEFLAAADTSSYKIEYEIEKDGRYILRMQPELLHGIEYSLSITTAPSLAFPVRESDKPRISSLWGADRDGGSRSHEGIDIVAKFRTPVVAAADGQVTRVNENNLGGKVIFMRPEGKNYSLYYAHLDSQIARPGQEIRTGDILGLIGNTGNARTTIPHLHFGIYSSAGAVDPLPFVERNRPAPKNISVSPDNINKYLRTQSVATVYISPSTKSAVLEKMETGHVMKVTGATENFYKIKLPDDREGFINGAALTSKNLRNLTLKSATRLLDSPSLAAAAKTTIRDGTQVTILGQYEDFYLVSYENWEGWIAIR